MPAHAHLAGRAREEPALEVAGLLRDHLDAVLREPLSREQRAAVRALLRCRTAQLGGHLDNCAACGFARPSCNSCRKPLGSAPGEFVVPVRVLGALSRGKVLDGLALGASVSSDSLPRTKAAPQLVALMPCTAPRGSFTPNAPSAAPSRSIDTSVATHTESPSATRDS